MIIAAALIFKLACLECDSLPACNQFKSAPCRGPVTHHWRGVALSPYRVIDDSVTVQMGDTVRVTIPTANEYAPRIFTRWASRWGNDGRPLYLTSCQKAFLEIPRNIP